MKKTELKKLVNEAVSEVLKEVLTVPTDKDPLAMNPNEKKQVLAKVRLQAGISDPNAPMDLVKKEQKTKLSEMPRTAIMYKLADDWQEKYTNPPSKNDGSPSIPPKWLTSPARKRWMEGIIDYLEQNGEGDITTIAKDYFNVPQPMLADYGRALIAAGVLVPAGMKGKDDIDASKIVPQFLRIPETDPDVDEEGNLVKSLKDFGSRNSEGGLDAEDLFVGKEFGDDFGDDETGEGGDSIEYTYDGDPEPDEEDGLEKSTSNSKLSSEDMDILMQFDDLAAKVSKIKSNLRRNPNISKKGGVQEVSTDAKETAAQQRKLKELYDRKLEELHNLLRTHGALIKKYRDVAKMLKSANIEIEDDAIADDSDTAAPINENLDVLKRFQKLANIKK